MLNFGDRTLSKLNSVDTELMALGGWQFIAYVTIWLKALGLALHLLYIVPMNINGYVPFLINMLDTIVRGWKYTK